MSLLTNIRGWFRNMLFPQAVAEREFGVSPAVSPKMEQNISLWYAMFIGNPPWQTCDVIAVGASGRRSAGRSRDRRWPS